MLLVHNIPTAVESSWLKGELQVEVKDAVLENSGPWRHAEELERAVADAVTASATVVLLLTDGGPDHNLTFAVVQASHIATCLHLNLDVLLRTVPNNSWRNPVERSMSTPNLALQ